MTMTLGNTPESYQLNNGSYELDDRCVLNGTKRPEKPKIGLKEPRLKARYFVVLFGFLADFFFYYHRITMSVSIVAMVNSTYLPTEDLVTSSSRSCVNLIEHLDEKNVTVEISEQVEGEFSWSPEMQGYIIGSSFLCYLIAMPFFAKLAEIYGCKVVLFWSLFLASVFTFLTPFATFANVYVVIVVQSLRGAAQGGILPTESLLVANWCPKPERGLSYTFIASGCAFGAVLGSYISGFLCDSALLGGWRSAFFVSGGAGIILSLLVLFYLYDNPSVHPKISLAELDYINRNQENILTEKRPKTPWRSLFTSIPVYALGYAYFGQMWALSHFLSAHPTFLKTILHYSVEQDGEWTALPFLLQFFTAQLGSILSTLLNNRNYISVDKARKFWTFLSCFGYSMCVLGIYFAGCNREASIPLSIVALSFVGFGYAGCWIVSTDMSPTFAGIYFAGCNREASIPLSIVALSFVGFGYAGCWIVSTDMSPTFAASVNAISCTMGSLAHFILPVIVGYLTNDSQLIEQWHKIFFICITVVLSSGVVFAIFGSAEIQPWNEVPKSDSHELDQKLKS